MIIKIARAQAVQLPTDPLQNRFSNLGDVVTKALPYVFTLAGIALLFVIISGGITLMTSGGDPAKTKEGYGKIISGIIGFLIIFASYFIAQLVQTMLGMRFL